MMSDFLAEDLMADELMAGRSKRKTKYKIKRRRKMRTKTKSLRKRQTNLSQRRHQRKVYKRRMRTDMNFRKNRQDYRKQYYKKHKKGSIGYTLPFELEFLYEGKPAYLMSLSEMFDAVNIYVEGETALVVDLNDFLARTEWYLEEDIELFQDLIRESYAVIDEDPQDAWKEFTLDERDPPAKRHIDKRASMRDLKLIYRESSGLDDEDLEEYGPNAFSSYYYHMPLSKDFFYHYTNANRVEDIIADGYLRPNHISDDDAPGASGVYAISGVWGWDVYSVQMSGGKKSRAKEMVALKFKTDTKPKMGYVEEVVWNKPVKLKDVEVVSIAQARRDLIGRKEDFYRLAGNHSEMFVFYDAGEAMKAKKNYMKTRKASICDRTDNLAILQMLLAVLRGAHFAHWTSHWQVKGQNFYGDHELMGRVYNTLIEEIDTLAEKIVGTYGVNAVNAVEQAQLMANHLLPLAEAHSMNDPIRRALLIEEGLQVIFNNAYDMLKEQGGLTLGMDDFIMSMANTHESNLYLLRQRCDL